ncbi:MAG TPA: hypothetical protein VIH33_02090 [Candidatus Limnocylindria bacterium]
MKSRPVTSPRPAAFGVALLALALVACGRVGGSASPSISAPSAALPSESAGTSPISTPTTAPSADLGAFTCDMPIEGAGTVDRAQITDVRVGTHGDYDRVVIEFDEGIPSYTLDEATPPLLADPSGMTMDVEGSAFWSLVLQGGTRVTVDGSMSYDGRTDFTPDFPALAELVEAGDFEAVSSWYIGLHASTCARVLTLTDPTRLVIDIQH